MGTLSPANVTGGRRSRRTRRGGSSFLPALSPAPVDGMGPDHNPTIPSGGVGAGFGHTGGYRRSRRGGGPLTPSPYPPDSNVGYNGVNMPVGAGSASLSGGRRKRRSRRSRRSRR